MSALAKYCILLGCKVSGRDENYSKNVEELVEWGARISIGETSSDLEKADLVVYTASIKRNHPEYVRAVELGKKMISRDFFLHEISQDFGKIVAVSGTHGKTTTCAMITSILLESEMGFTAHVGGKSEKGNLVYKGDDIFITEACEYNRSFLALKPDVSLILNVEMDHPDTYQNEEQLYDAFRSFACNLKCNGTLVVNADSRYYDFIKSTHKDMRTYAIKNTADLTARNIINYGNGIYGFQIVQKGYQNLDIRLSISGYHNVENALGAIIVSRILGVPERSIQRGLEKFKGVSGRMEYLGENDGSVIYRDYAHHPTEISVALRTIREMYPNHKIITLFQPHTRRRTEALLEDFGKALIDSDELFILKEYLAREENGGKGAYELYLETKKMHDKVYYFGTHLDVVKGIKESLGRGKVLLILGAGDVMELGALFIKEK